MHVLIDDQHGLLTMRRLWPWQRILLAVGEPGLPAAARPPFGAARPVRVPLRPAPISGSAPLLAELASRLLEPGPVPVRGVAMVTELLADGAGLAGRSNPGSPGGG
jgi:hypothetical protein